MLDESLLGDSFSTINNSDSFEAYWVCSLAAVVVCRSLAPSLPCRKKEYDQDVSVEHPPPVPTDCALVC